MYKILIVEDDKTIANAVKKHVETWGYQAYATQNFQNVMEDFAREHPHLVILDITLPLQWLSLVQRNPQGVQGSDFVSFVSGG